MSRRRSSFSSVNLRDLLQHNLRNYCSSMKKMKKSHRYRTVLIHCSLRDLADSSRGYYVLHLSFSQLYRVYLAKTPVGTTRRLFRRCCIDTDRFADENYGNPAGSSARCRIPITAERPTDKKPRNSLSYRATARTRRIDVE